MAKAVVIENYAERKLVRSAFKNAHCRKLTVHNKTGFYVFFNDKKNKLTNVILGFHENNRAEAWAAAAQAIGTKMVKKLES